MAGLYDIVRLHVPGTPFAARVQRIVSAFETIYGSFLYLPTPSNIVRSHEMWRFVVSDVIGYQDADAWVPRPSEGSQALIVREIREVGSFDISMSGAGDAIDAAAEICDPARRRERRERLRHAQKMNKFAEEHARLDAELKSLDLIQRQIDMINGMIRHGIIEADEGQERIRQIVGLQDRAGEIIEREDAVVAEIVEDDRRELEG